MKPVGNAANGRLMLPKLLMVPPPLVVMRLYVFVVLGAGVKPVSGVMLITAPAAPTVTLPVAPVRFRES